LSDEKIYSGETEDMANDGEGFLGGIKDAWIGYLQAMGSDEDN